MKRYVYSSSRSVARTTEEYLKQNLNPSLGYDSAVNDTLLNRVEGLPNKSALLFAKLFDAWTFRSPRSFSSADLSLALDRWFDVFPEDSEKGEFALGDYGYPVKLMKSLVQELESRGYSVRCYRGPVGSHSEWLVEYKQ